MSLPPNGQLSIETLFSGARVFRIPDYQRAYAWDVDPHVLTFLEDLHGHSANGGHFYFGTLLLQEGLKEQGFSSAFIVDGQQRLTTLVVLVSVALSTIENKLKPPLACSEYDPELARKNYIKYENRWKFHTVKDDDSFFINYILGVNDPPGDRVDTPSQRRLLAAKRYLSKTLAEFSEAELIALLQKIDNAIVLLFSVQDAGEATQIFELHNDRGKRLTQLEAVKSYLMHTIYLKGKKEDHEQHLTHIQDLFGQIYRDWQFIEDLEQSIGGDDGEDSILRYHWIAFQTWEDKNQIKPKELLKTLIRKMNDEEAVEWIKNFALSLRESFSIVLIVLRKMEEEVALAEVLSDIYVLGRIATFIPLLMKTYKADGPAHTQFQRVARLVEMFSFRAYGIANVRSDFGWADFNKWARDFNGNFPQLIDNLKDMCVEKNEIGRRFEEGLNASGFYYQRRDALYLLWKYENDLRSRQGQANPKITWKQFIDDDPKRGLSIEHIAAQKGDEVVGSLLSLEIDQEAERKEFREQCLHSIGNLVIASRSSNAGIGNNPHLKKREFYLGQPVMSQNEIPAKYSRWEGDFPRWDKTAVKLRGLDLIAFAKRSWDPKPI